MQRRNLNMWSNAYKELELKYPEIYNLGERIANCTNFRLACQYYYEGKEKVQAIKVLNKDEGFNKYINDETRFFKGYMNTTFKKLKKTTGDKYWKE